MQKDRWPVIKQTMDGIIIVYGITWRSSLQKSICEYRALTEILIYISQLKIYKKVDDPVIKQIMAGIIIVYSIARNSQHIFFFIFIS